MSEEHKEDTRHLVDEPSWTEEQLQRRRKRGRVLGMVLTGLVLLFFLVTIVKLGGNVANRPI